MDLPQPQGACVSSVPGTSVAATVSTAFTMPCALNLFGSSPTGANASRGPTFLIPAASGSIPQPQLMWIQHSPQASPGSGVEIGRSFQAAPGANVGGYDMLRSSLVFVTPAGNNFMAQSSICPVSAPPPSANVASSSNSAAQDVIPKAKCAPAPFEELSSEPQVFSFSSDNVTCLWCAELMPDDRLYMHISIHHFNYFRYKCPSCSFMAHYSDLVIRHAVERKHVVDAIDRSSAEPTVHRLVQLLVSLSRAASKQRSTDGVFQDLDSWAAMYSRLASELPQGAPFEDLARPDSSSDNQSHRSSTTSSVETGATSVNNNQNSTVLSSSAASTPNNRSQVSARSQSIVQIQSEADSSGRLRSNDQIENNSDQLDAGLTSANRSSFVMALIKQEIMSHQEEMPGSGEEGAGASDTENDELTNYRNQRAAQSAFLQGSGPESRGVEQLSVSVTHSTPPPSAGEDQQQRQEETASLELRPRCAICQEQGLTFAVSARNTKAERQEHAERHLSVDGISPTNTESRAYLQAILRCWHRCFPSDSGVISEGDISEPMNVDPPMASTHVRTAQHDDDAATSSLAQLTPVFRTATMRKSTMKPRFVDNGEEYVRSLQAELKRSDSEDVAKTPTEAQESKSVRGVSQELVQEKKEMVVTDSTLLPLRRTRKCRICSANFSNDNAQVIRRHVWVVHCSAQPFACAHCAYSSTSSFVVKRHSMARHGSAKLPLFVAPSKKLNEEFNGLFERCFPPLSVFAGPRAAPEEEASLLNNAPASNIEESCSAVAERYKQQKEMEQKKQLLGPQEKACALKHYPRRHKRQRNSAFSKDLRPRRLSNTSATLESSNECRLCARSVQPSRRLRHVWLRHMNEDQPYTCTHCNRKALSKKRLLERCSKDHAVSPVSVQGPKGSKRRRFLRIATRCFGQHAVAHLKHKIDLDCVEDKSSSSSEDDTAADSAAGFPGPAKKRFRHAGLIQGEDDVPIAEIKQELLTTDAVSVDDANAGLGLNAVAEVDVPEPALIFSLRDLSANELRDILSTVTPLPPEPNDDQAGTSGESVKPSDRQTAVTTSISVSQTITANDISDSKTQTMSPAVASQAKKRCVYSKAPLRKLRPAFTPQRGPTIVCQKCSVRVSAITSNAHTHVARFHFPGMLFECSSGCGYGNSTHKHDVFKHIQNKHKKDENLHIIDRKKDHKAELDRLYDECFPGHASAVAAATTRALDNLAKGEKAANGSSEKQVKDNLPDSSHVRDVSSTPRSAAVFAMQKLTSQNTKPPMPPPVAPNPSARRPLKPKWAFGGRLASVSSSIQLSNKLSAVKKRLRICQLCRKSFASQTTHETALLYHVWKEHCSAFPFTCGHCNEYRQFSHAHIVQHCQRLHKDAQKHKIIPPSQALKEEFHGKLNECFPFTEPKTVAGTCDASLKLSASRASVETKKQHGSKDSHSSATAVSRQTSANPTTKAIVSKQSISSASGSTAKDASLESICNSVARGVCGGVKTSADKPSARVTASKRRPVRKLSSVVFCRPCKKDVHRKNRHSHCWANHMGVHPYSCRICGREEIQRSKLFEYCALHHSAVPCDLKGPSDEQQKRLYEVMDACFSTSPTLNAKAEKRSGSVSSGGTAATSSLVLSPPVISAAGIIKSSHSRSFGQPPYKRPPPKSSHEFHPCRICRKNIQRFSITPHVWCCHMPQKPMSCGICGASAYNQKRLEAKCRLAHPQLPSDAKRPTENLMKAFNQKLKECFHTKTELSILNPWSSFVTVIRDVPKKVDSVKTPGIALDMIVKKLTSARTANFVPLAKIERSNTANNSTNSSSSITVDASCSNNDVNKDTSITSDSPSLASSALPCSSDADSRSRSSSSFYGFPPSQSNCSSPLPSSSTQSPLKVASESFAGNLDGVRVEDSAKEKARFVVAEDGSSGDDSFEIP